MSRILTPLDTRMLQEWDGGRQKYRVLLPFAYESDVLGATVIVPRGFVCDGQSIPRAVVALTGHECREAGTAHDWLYGSRRLKMGDLPLETLRAIAQERWDAVDSSIKDEVIARVGKYVQKAVADLVYREILLLSGIDRVHADEQHAALDFWGKGPWETGPARLRVDR